MCRGRSFLLFRKGRPLFMVGRLNDNLSVSGNADDAEYTDERRLIFFSVQIDEALYFPRASAPVCVVCVLLISPLNSHLRSPHKKMYHFTPKKCKFVFLSKRNDDLSKGFRVKKTFFAANLLNES